PSVASGSFPSSVSCRIFALRCEASRPRRWSSRPAAGPRPRAGGPGAWRAAVDPWDPERYGRFAAERAAPFHDLLSLVRPVPGGRVVDLGCGGGELTAELHRRLEAAETLGLDSSAAMLEGASAPAGGRPR